MYGSAQGTYELLVSVSLVSRPLQFGTERPVAHREIRSDIRSVLLCRGDWVSSTVLVGHRH